MNRNVLRFSIAFLLFVCLCVAGFLGGYRAGYPTGYASGQAKRMSEEPYPKLYDVGDLLRERGDNGLLVGDQLDYNTLISATQATVFPSEWEQLGGPCTMIPLPWRETLVVNATSGVHEGLQEFYGDLSSVRLAFTAAKKDLEAMQQMQDKWIKSILEPVSKSIDKELSLTDADIDLIGSWNVRRDAPENVTASERYTFVDEETVRVPKPKESGKSMDTWYVTSPGSMVIAGDSYITAMTSDNELVLIPSSDPQKFMVATRADDKP